MPEKVLVDLMALIRLQNFRQAMIDQIIERISVLLFRGLEYKTTVKTGY